jgi:PAS domain S-box-containing protein
METSSAEGRFLWVQLEVAQAALSSLPPDPLMQTLLDTICRAQDYRYGLYWRVVEDTHEAVVPATFGEAMGRFLGWRQDLGDPGSYVAEAIRTRQPLSLNRLQEGAFGRHPMIQCLNAQAVLALPLVHRAGHVVGALAFADKENPERFTADDLTQGMILAHQMARALENAESFRHVQRLEAQYRLVIESLQDAVYIVDAEGRITFANPALARLTGYPVEALLGHLATAFYASTIPPLLLDARQTFPGELLPPPIEVEVIRSDGAQVPVELSMTNLLVDGQMVGHIAVVRDATARKRAEEKFRLVVEAAPNAMLMINQAGTIVLVNAQTEALFGYPRAELIGQPVERLVPERYRCQHPAHRTAFFAAPGVRPMGAGRDLYGLHKNGHEIPIEIGLNPLTTEEGTFVLAAIIDITARKRAEDRFRAAVESAPNAVVIVDHLGKILLVNAQTEQLFGYSREALIDQPVEILVPERFRRQHPAYRAGFFAEPRSRPMGEGRDLYGLRKDGTEFPIEIGLNPIKTEEGTLVLSAIVDITARKRAEEQLRQAAAELVRSNAELEQFAYVASHDLQEPLRAVAGCVQALQQRYHGTLDAHADEFIKHAVDGAIRMQTLINDLLDYSRVAMRGKPFVPTDCAAIVRSVLANLEVAMTESGARVTYTDLPTVMADPTQLTQLFQNLIGNACKFRSQRPPAIHIAAEHQEGAWVFAVRDNGIGIEPQYFERIFGLFQRLHTRVEYAGTGIGLAICKRIVERHGGRIWVESRPQQESTFYFTIPEQR